MIFKTAITAVAITAMMTVSASAGMLTDANGVTWTYPDSVLPGQDAVITVTSVGAGPTLSGVALLATSSTDQQTVLTLQTAAVPFSTAQIGPGFEVGEFMTSNFVGGVETIFADLPDAPGIYEFNARSQVVGAGPLDNPFVIEVAVPEPASMALLGLGGLMVLRRKRR